MWDYLEEKLALGAAIDVQLSYRSGGGHFVTLNGLYWDDSNNNSIIDASENARLYYINPSYGSASSCHLWQWTTNGTLETDDFSGWISSAFAMEAIRVPEPATLCLLTLGGWLIARRRV